MEDLDNGRHHPILIHQASYENIIFPEEGDLGQEGQLGLVDLQHQLIFTSKKIGIFL
jgi:hypothetical protein